MKRSKSPVLTLRRSTLRNLSSRELAGAAGGMAKTQAAFPVPQPRRDDSREGGDGGSQVMLFTL